MSEVIFSIGHSTRPLDQLLTLLRARGIHTLVDIRSIPHSRRSPQYNQEALQQVLQVEGIGYKHLASLGGHRRAGEDSPNTGWLNRASRGYADYMQTAAFEQGLCELEEFNRVASPVAIMCSEAVPWRCHRSMVADALVVRGTAASRNACDKNRHPTPACDATAGRRRQVAGGDDLERNRVELAHSEDVLFRSDLERSAISPAIPLINDISGHSP